MAFFVQFKNFKGSVTEQHHRGWVAFDSLNFSVQNNIKVRPGHTDDRIANIPNLTDFVLTKKVDKSSPKLLESACNGSANEQVIIHVCNDASNTAYLQYTLHHVMINYYDINGLNSADSSSQSLIETLALNASKVEMKLIPFNAENKSESPIVTGYDITEARTL